MNIEDLYVEYLGTGYNPKVMRENLLGATVHKNIEGLEPQEFTFIDMPIYEAYFCTDKGEVAIENKPFTGDSGFISIQMTIYKNNFYCSCFLYLDNRINIKEYNILDFNKLEFYTNPNR